MTVQLFTEAQIEALREVYARIDNIRPERLGQFHALLDQCSDEAIEQLAAARIKFVSKLAANEARRRGLRGSRAA